MRILGMSQRVYLGDIYLALQREGHAVRVFATDTPDECAFGGLIDTVPDWRAELGWVGRDGIILFEGVRQGALQDELRAAGYRVIGSSAYGDRLENERDFGQAVLQDAGLSIAASQGFETHNAASRWLAAHPGRFVLKHDGGAHATFVGEHAQGADVAFCLRRRSGQGSGGRVLLMPRLDGVEVGVGGYFDGHAFLRPACIDFEHKRFFPGELGEMTGEMGTLASFEHAEALFAATLDRVAPQLARAGHRGYVNLNLIVNEAGLWPLEFTCRIGNPGFAVLAALQCAGWGDLLERMAGTGRGPVPVDSGWSVAIVLSVPPFPGWTATGAPEEDAPVFFHRAPTAGELARYHWVDMRCERGGSQSGGQLLVHRRSGHAMIVTGTGSDVTAAQHAARTRARNVIIPELRWRADIGDRFLRGDAARLAALGWLPPAFAA